MGSLKAIVLLFVGSLYDKPCTVSDVFIDKSHGQNRRCLHFRSTWSHFHDEIPDDLKTGSILKTALELPINNLYTPEEDLSKSELPANIQYDFQNNKDSNPTNQHLNPAKYFKRILLLESPKRYNPDFLKEPFYPQYLGKPEDKKSLEFLGKRVPENSPQHGGDTVFGPNKRWSEFLGKRMSEFLGKRNDKRWSEFLGKRQEYQQPTIFQQEASKRWSEFLGK